MIRHFIKHTFNRSKITGLIIGETIGKFIGFMVGIWSANLFTYHIYERKNIHNLFGLLKRKQIVVHRAPLWIEWLFSVLIGFIAMQLVHFLIQELNNRLFLGRKCLKGYVLLKRKFQKNGL
jgi:hypothetical protein